MPLPKEVNFFSNLATAQGIRVRSRQQKTTYGMRASIVPCCISIFATFPQARNSREEVLKWKTELRDVCWWCDVPLYHLQRKGLEQREICENDFELRCVIKALGQQESSRMFTHCSHSGSRTHSLQWGISCSYDSSAPFHTWSGHFLIKLYPSQYTWMSILKWICCCSFYEGTIWRKNDRPLTCSDTDLTNEKPHLFISVSKSHHSESVCQAFRDRCSWTWDQSLRLALFPDLC